MSRSTIHRNSSSLHIEKLHQKQLMREMDDQYKQASSLHISRLLSKEIENKLEVSQCVRDVMQKSCKKIKDDYNKSRFITTHHTKQSNNLEGKFRRNQDGLKKIKNKMIKFKNRILPQQYDLSKVQRKLNQIMYIQNEGHIQKEDKYVYSKLLESKHQKQQVIFGDNLVVNKYWNDSQQLSRESLKKIKQNRVNMLIRQNIDADQDMNQINEIKANLNKKLTDNIGGIRNSADYLNKTSHFKKQNNRHTNYSSLDTSTDGIQIQQTKNQTNNKLKKNGLTKEIVQNSFIDYLKHKKQRKVFLNRLNKELIESEDALKIYSFIKGGYNLDPYDIEGQFISLKRFNEAKQSFSTLNQLYKSFKDQCFYGRQQKLRANEDRSFKSVVYVNELSGKIAPNQLLKLMRQKKIVK